MQHTAHRAIAIVGAAAILPDAPNLASFWQNIKQGRYSISEVRSDRWDPALYYDPDPAVPDKTYSKIGGWVREHSWDPLRWHLPIPPRVAAAMDDAQKWAISCTRDAMMDYGYPERQLDPDRTAVILGNAMAGEKHYLTSLRVQFPEYAHELEETASFAALPAALRHDITRELHDSIARHLPEITEDTMPGELANCISGRIANLFNFHGPNYVVDAACASAMAAISSAIEGLEEDEFDLAITGGIDRNMGASTFIKFCKIGALSATGTRPYAEGADGFVMGEGTVIFLLKRLADAERDGDKIYAVLRGIAGSSDGKGKGITAPNPIGQKLCIQRAWQNAGLSPATATFIEGHGTSTRVGDVVEVQSLAEVLGNSHPPKGSVALGSVKSNIGHLKGAAGAAGLLKTVLALRDKVLPPSVHCEHPNPDIDFAHSPLYVNTELKEWTVPDDGVRRAGVSAFGFGGTNFHAVLEEYLPGTLTDTRRFVAMSELLEPPEVTMNAMPISDNSRLDNSDRRPLRGALVMGATSEAELAERLRSVQKDAENGRTPALDIPAEYDLHAPERVAIDFSDAADLADKAAKALKGLSANQSAMWKVLRAQGIFRGQGPAPKVAFLYTGQGSQYVNMLQSLREAEPIVHDTFAEADRTLTPVLGKALTEFIFIDQSDDKAFAAAEESLRQTAITQPAVLAADIALTRLLAAYGITPDMTMGHSLGEYGALVASGALPFDDALLAVSARGREMTRVSIDDNGRMAAVFAPYGEIERILKTVPGYLVIANINSYHQGVIGGASKAVDQAVLAFQDAGFNAIPLPVSHAFHTSIVAPASEPLKQVLERLHLQPPRVPIVANVNGELYPNGEDAVPKMLDILARQIASPVQFVKGLRTLYDTGARIFVEVGPKKALQGLAEDVLGDRADVVSLFTNHPKTGDIPSFNQALCGLYAAGLGRGRAEAARPTATSNVVEAAPTREEATEPIPAPSSAKNPSPEPPASENEKSSAAQELRTGASDRSKTPLSKKPVVITGAALGLPGTENIFDDANIGRILRGDQFIDAIPTRFRRAMLDKHITRLVKSDNGGPTFETITSLSDVIKLAGRGGMFDLENEFGVSSDRIAALDRVTQLAIAAGIDGLRDAGIPLVMRYKTTSKGTKLPDRWGLPDNLRDETGVIFASAFPGYDSFADEMSRYYADHARRDQLTALESLRARAAETDGHSPILQQEIERRMEELRAAIESEPYVFDRRFLFRTLAMGHSQFAEFIDARGPNTQINAACASTTQAVAIAEDWIHTGRCRRVIVISADDVTSDHLIDWMGAGFLASGAAATDDVVEDAALPFDRRRHGMLIGMGAAALVIEDADAARERGIQPICEVLSAVTANSAFHGSRLDVEHIGQVMEKLIAQAETQSGIDRHQVAPQTVFVSHETYTPARGGSASAEIHALRHVFGDTADRIVIANTKGFTGHAMGTGIEDVVAVKALETGCVPPVANFQEVDPELGALNLSKGGVYPVEYALRLGAGFGSQISMTLLHWLKTQDGVRRNPNALGYTHRIVDSARWNEWLRETGGDPAPSLEVVHRTLRIRDEAASARAAKTTQDFRPARALETAVETTASAVSVQAMLGVASQRARPQDVTPVTQPTSADPATQDGWVKDRVLALISETTGYPLNMLGLDLDLEADLGVDTVKQAEAFATIREIFGIERDETLRLRDFPTLTHVVQFVHEKRPDLAPATQGPKAVAAAPTLSETADKQEVVSEKAAPSTTATADSVRDHILSLVVEKTGYPKDMLDLELDLEADLGVDTVKQAEMFAAIRENYSIARDPNLKLRDFPTLAHVIRFVLDRRPDLAQAKRETPAPISSPAATVPPAPGAAQPPTDDDLRNKVLEIAAEKTGYPKDMLDLDLDLEADLGIDTVKQAEMFAAIRGAFNIPRDANLKLHDFPTLAHVIKFAHDRTAGSAKTEVPAPLEAVPGKQPEAPLEVPPAEAQPLSPDVFREKVLEIAAEKTGYPKDMLDLDLDLEADLGIDTVKQAEMFAAIRTAFNIPRDANLKLRNFPTLAHVIKFAQDRTAGPGKTEAQAPEKQASAEETPPAATSIPTKTPPTPASFDRANSIPRRVPVPTLRPPLSMCKPTPVRLGAGKRVVLMPDLGGVGKELKARLQSMGTEVLYIEDVFDAEALADRLAKWVAAGPVDGVYWLPALDHETDLAQMDLDGWHKAIHVRLKLLYATMRKLYDHIASKGTFLVSATKLGGHHGYDEPGAVAPLGGAVVGFVKTYKRERNDATVKAIDFEAQSDPTKTAELLIEETLHDPGAVEIGYKDGLRWTVGLDEQPAADGRPGLTLGEDSVFLVTGAAGSIVSAITADLAAASGGTFYLLDLIPEPKANDTDLQRFATDKEGLKRDLFARIQARGERATPVMVEKQLAALERAQAAQSAIDAIRAAGGTARYFSIDIKNPAAVAEVIANVRTRSKRIDVLLHAAGIERSHMLPDKDPREFDLVFDVKADGFFNLLHSLGDMPIGVTVVFSSVAGRFGNAGQADYSSANDLLCKITSSFRSARPAMRAIAVDWTAWAGMGMATRGSIPKMMEAAGIDMLPPEAGIPTIRRELTVGGTCGEVVVGEHLGNLMNEWDETGGLDPAAPPASQQGPMIGTIASMGIQTGLVVETTLDPKLQPFLHDHRIDGTPVLPGVMGIEAFAEAAGCVLPGWQVVAVEDVTFLAPFKFYRNEPRTLTVHAMYRPEGPDVVAECRLTGSRQLPGQAEPQIITHFTGRVRMARAKATRLQKGRSILPLPESIMEASDIYHTYFHGPAYQVVEKAWCDGKQVVGLMATRLPANHAPANLPTTMAPRLIELCFQTAGLWEIGFLGRFGLPQHVDFLRICRAPELVEGGLYAVVYPSSDGTSFGAEVVDSAGSRYVELNGYRTVAVPAQVATEPMKSLQRAWRSDFSLAA